MSDREPMLHVFDGHTASWALLHALASVLDRTDDRALMIGNTSDARRAIGAGLVRFDRIQARGNRQSRGLRLRDRYMAAHGYTPHTMAFWDSHAGIPTQSYVNNDDVEFTAHYVRAVQRSFPVRALNRPDVRASWGISDDTFVIGSAHDHPREIDAMRLVYHAAILSVAEIPTVAVIPSGADQLERAARWAWRHDRVRWFVVDDRSPLLLRDAVDVSCWQVGRRAIRPDIYTHQMYFGCGDDVWKLVKPGDGVRTLEMIAASGQPVVAERCERTAGLTGENVRQCEPNSELGATRALFKDLVRLDATPEPQKLIDALRGSLVGV